MSWAGEQMLDSMLAETGYAIPESQLPELADRIQHLENLVSTTQICEVLDPSAITNPSDISAWINTLIKGTATPCPAALDADEQQLLHSPDLLLQDSSCSSSVTKADNPTNSTSGSNLSLPVMMHLVEDDQEQAEASGLRLIHLLLACAACIEDEAGVEQAEAMVNEIRVLVLTMGERAGAMGRVALYFAQGLERRMINLRRRYAGGAAAGELMMMLDEDDPSFVEMLHLHFYHTCPYLKFGHFTANQAMLEELQEERAVHIVDLGLGLGLQWPPLIHMLAIRPRGPPLIRFTAVAPQPHLRFQVQQSGIQLARLAKTVNVDLRFHMVDEVRAVQPQPGEALAVNATLQLHRHLHDPNRITGLLADIRRLSPKIFTVVEQDASHNSDDFQSRFVEALHFYSSMFDSLDAGCKLPLQAQHEESVTASEVYLGREIGNIIACEGPSRVERHERLEEWRHRLYSMGFRPRHLGSNAFNQAATLLTIFPGGGHNIQETAGCLTLGWQSRPLIAASAWKCS